MTAHAAFLRVYEPLAAFSDPERTSWQAYLAQGAAPSPSDGPGLEHRAAVRALRSAHPAVLPELPAHAYVAEVDGVPLVCPWSTRLRALEGLEVFAGQLPDEVLGAYLPLSLARAASDELAAWRANHPDERVHQLSSTWQVPLRWFVAVDAAERELRLGVPTPSGAGPTRLVGRCLRYRTAMSRARRRTARALRVLQRTVDDGAATAGVEDLGRWLEEFHPRSLVELDYGGLVHLLDDAALEQDDSARDIAGALAALDRGDPNEAAQAYLRVTERMKTLQAVESAN